MSIINQKRQSSLKNSNTQFGKNIQGSLHPSFTNSSPSPQRKSVKQVKINEKPQIQKKVRFLLCVDPESHNIYTLNLETNEIHVELDVPYQYRKRAEDDITQIAKIVQLPDSEWNITSKEAWRYRRRMMSEYLLHKMIDPEPTYLAQSPMSDAFSNQTSLKFMVDVSEYLKLEEDKIHNLNPLVIELDIDLVTSADEVVKKILRQVYNIFSTRLKPIKDENQFILQISGFKEYLSGNYPMLSYDRVRVSLRGIQYLQVNLTEVSKEKKVQSNFPPIFFLGQDDIKRGIINVPWDDFLEVPTLLFYPRYPLPQYNFQAPNFGGNNNQVTQEQQTTNQDNKNKVNFEQASPQIPRQSLYTKPSSQTNLQNTNINSHERIQQEQKYNEQNFIPLQPRVLVKEKQVEFNKIRLTMINQGIINLNHNTLYSGECDWPFKVRLVGLTNIFRLLVLDDKDCDELKRFPKKRATYNGINYKPDIGLCPMRFLTKASAKQEELHNTSKKKNKSGQKEEKKKEFVKFTKASKVENGQLFQKNIFPPHINHGSQGQSALVQMATKYELDFSPYLISLEVMLMYGEVLLTKFTKVKSSAKPFRKLPRWDEILQFSGLKISQLPMEVRLCINIIIHSSSGDQQVIGCTVLDIFDDNGRFRSGRQELNVWPFYKIDNRLACLGNYTGVPIKGQSQPGYYCKLILALDSFDTDMFWSLRNHNVMQKLGFFRSMRCKSQIHALSGKEKDETEQQDHSQQQQISSIYKKANQIGLYQKEPEWKEVPKNDEISRLEELLNIDPLNRANITDKEKFILLKCRYYYRSKGKYFSMFLWSIDWSDPEQVAEVYQLQKQWEPLPQNEALPILDAMISDEAVRLYATQRIEKYRDDELVLFMLELTQALMFEQQHFSALGEMLIERAIMDPWVVGHELFWQLRSQLHIQPSYERFALLLEQFLMLCGQYRVDLLREVEVNDEIMRVAEGIKDKRNDNDEQKKIVLSEMQDELKQTRNKFKKTFQFAIDPRMACSELMYPQCKILDSKKLPLWLTMKASEVKEQNQSTNYSPDIKIVTLQMVRNPEQLKTLNTQKEERKSIKTNSLIRIIYKCGDDIRQDLLTLQLIKIMDKIWLDFGTDFRMKPYRVVSTLDQVGMIEVVLNSMTISDIHKSSGSFGALNKSSIMEYLKKHNKNNMDNAVENFLRSCAGYCVATYILGIGDRHSGNIMLTEMGHLFHIDFGHFLGNFKTKMGFNRERAPFVFTEEMAYVMGGITGVEFKRFEFFCTQAYNQVRKHGHFLINIFMMMLSAGMPELQDIGDIEYLKDQLSLDLSDQEATEKFRKEIINSLNDSWRKIDNFIHNIKRSG